MIRALIAAAALALAFGVPAFASDGNQPPKGPGPNFEERKSELLKNIDERINSLQEGKKCVEAAQNHDDLKACREKQRKEMEKARSEMKDSHEHGGPGNRVPPAGQ
jgi:hypothetical protein